MASYSQSIRSGLPRVPGGEPWPPAGTLAGAPAVAVAPEPSAAPAQPAPAQAPVEAPAAQATEPAAALAEPAAPAPVDAAAAEAAQPAEAAAAATVAGATAELSSVPLRRGLPRVAGGDPWPPEGFAPAGTATSAAAVSGAAVPGAAVSGVAEATQSAVTAQATGVQAATPVTPASAETPEAAPAPAAASVAAPVVFGTTPLRRGLPRVAGGDPWPPEGLAPERAVAPSAPAAAVPAAVAEPAPAPASSVPAASAPPAPAAQAPAQAQAAQAATAVAATPAAPASSPAAAATPAAPAKPAREPRMIGSRSLSQWVKLGSLGVVGLIVLAGVIVLAARGVTTLPGVPEFVERYPGEYHPAVEPDEGFPAWARWTHYLNLFFMVLIVRTGLTVRHQQKPDAFYTPKKGGKKISIHLWLHTSIDLLWLANGVIFVVLLFVTGHWARIVPTSWEVFPNAASAMLQYLTLDWPVENGWVNYNALQQLMYFIIVFIAAPVAAITGLRMSEWWPKNNEKLDRVFPAPLARALHYPTMLFFVIFVIIHVFLVMTTGALRNLNHMYAGNDGTGWFGFWMFTAGLGAIAVAWFLTRPLLVAPIANLFGKVSNR